MLKLSVKNREISISPDYNPLLSGARYVDQVQFSFDEEWKPYSKTVIFFIDKEDPVTVPLPFDDEIIDIPNEMLSERGYITIGVVGTASFPETGKVARITSSAFRYLIKAGVAEQINFEEETPSNWDQYVDRMNDYVLKGEGAASRALQSEQNAKDSEEKAKASEEAAAQSAESAAQSAQEAQDANEQTQELLEQALASEQRTKESADKALVSEQASKASEDRAKASQLEADRSEKNSKESELNAKDSENAAKESELLAKESQEASKASELASAESAQNALESELLAKAAEENVLDLHDEVEILAEDVTRQHIHIHQDHVLIHEDLKTYTELHEDFVELEANIVNAQIDFNETETHIEQMHDETLTAAQNAKESEDCSAKHDENAYNYMVETKKYQERAQIFAGLEMPEFYFDVETMSLNIKYPELKHPEVQRNIRFILVDNVLYWDLPQLNE